jgi:hypothetical protein
MASERSYPLSAQAWNAYRDLITITLADGSTVAHLPVAFVRDGGDDTWGYVMRTVQLLVECDERYSCEIKGSDGLNVVLDEQPNMGSYVFSQPGKTTSFGCSCTGR